MPTVDIDGIATRYEVTGSGPPLLMFAPGGFDATVEKWSTLGVYARTRPIDHLSRHYTCIVFDRRETGQSGGRVECITWAHYVKQGHGLLAHLKIGGYTDNIGAPADNLRLSQERAVNVRAQLISMGVEPYRLEAEGYGEAHPVADNATEAGRAMNRRISLLVTQK